jgi:hypothetical protein
VLTLQDTAAVLSWFVRDEMIARLTAELGDDDAGGLSAAERQARSKQLKAKLDALERQEELLVVQALGEGIACDRRPDASPAAILNVRVVKQAVAPGTAVTPRRTAAYSKPPPTK